MMSVVVLSSAGGVFATRYVTAQFEVNARIMIASDSPMENRTGPIRAGGLVEADDWSALLRSFVISDAVVRKLNLYLQVYDKDDEGYFKGFTLGEPFRPGEYELVIDKTRKRWTLASTPSVAPADSGGMADSLGRKLGFLWELPKWAFIGAGQHKVQFVISTPRETAVIWIARLNSIRQRQSNFLQLSLQDPDPKLAANVLNTWVNEFVSVAAAFKKRKLIAFATTLEEQLQTAKNSLDTAEARLQSFRINTITLPSEGSAISPGVAETRDPAMKAFFTQKIDFDDVKHDMRLLQGLMASVAKDSVPSDAFLEIRSVASAQPATAALRQAVQEYHTAENELAASRTILTDENPKVKDLVTKLSALKQVKIPGYAGELLTSLRLKAQDDSVRIDASADELKKIPERTIEEERLRRIRDIAAGLYANLQSRYAEAQLAEASAFPDVSVLDSAIAPLAATKDLAPRIIMIAIAGGLGAAIALAILLDLVDSRLRYPEQTTDELGLPIAGTIPRFPKGGVDQNSPEQMFQLVESFRSLRMSVLQAGGGSACVAISSPTPGEGKSLISANLAMSFADSGLRTALVDGDTRRGALNDMFGLTATPGLTDYLSGKALLNEVIRPTMHENLVLVPCGTRQRRSPELLTSPTLVAMVAELRGMYDVVIFDTPPLAAGVDGYSIASATGSLLVVLRVGQTRRRLASEKLRLFERLPVDIIGAVLNGVQFQGGYEYYGYVPGYDARDEPPAGTAVAEVT